VIIDIDFHHGNGVEEILHHSPLANSANGIHEGNSVHPNSPTTWRDRIQYVSLHAHPDYPYYTTHLPTPLSKSVTKTEYLSELRRGLALVETWCEKGETLVLVSLGLDTLNTDPIGGFQGLTCQADFWEVGGVVGGFVGRIGGRCCFLLEGGYVVDRLGECVEGVLRGFIDGVGGIDGNGAIENGTLENGTFENGTFENGTFENGGGGNHTYGNGTYDDGTNENEIHDNGTDENSTLRNGIEKNGTHENGTHGNGTHKDE
jgi:hypothetical protein